MGQLLCMSYLYISVLIVFNIPPPDYSHYLFDSDLIVISVFKFHILMFCSSL